MATLWTGVNTQSVDARNNCSVGEYDKLIDENGGESKFWFRNVLESQNTRKQSRMAGGHHRWHLQKKVNKGGCTRRKFQLSHGKRQCRAHNRKFHLFEYKFTDSTVSNCTYTLVSFTFQSFFFFF